MSSPKWSGKPKRFNPSRNFVMSDAGTTRKFNPKSTFSPTFTPSGPGIVPPSAPAAAAPVAGASIPGSPYGNAVPINSANLPLEPSADQENSEAIGTVPTMPSTEALEFAALYRPTVMPLHYNIYAPSPFRQSMKPLEPHERNADELALPYDLRRDLLERNTDILNSRPPYLNSEFVHVYHSLIPLAHDWTKQVSELLGHKTVLYKGISHNDGRAYCLVVCHDFEMTTENEHSLQAINKWKRVQSSFMQGVVEAFTTLAFSRENATAPGTPASPSRFASFSPPDDTSSAAAPSTPGPKSSPAPTTPNNSSGAGINGIINNGNHHQSLVVVYEYYPVAKPLSMLARRNEAVLWNVAVQIFSAIEAIHRKGLACRGALHENFILLQGESRVHLGLLGAQDILDRELGDVQAEDYKALAEILKRLGRGVMGSAPFNEFIAALSEANVERASQLLVPHLYKTLDQSFGHIETLEDHLSRELENGRLVRLLAKLEFVLNTREVYDPRHPLHPLALFKQYAFKQVNEEGKPALNLAHAIASLNKLDSGVDENVLLMSDNSKTRIVVNYKDLKEMCKTAFDEMSKA